MQPDGKMGAETRSFLEQCFAHADDLKREARRRGGAHADLLDLSGLVIDVMLTAARKRTQLQDPHKLKAWVRAILVREILERLQRKACRQRLPLGGDDLNQLPETRDDRERQAAEACAYVGRLLERLPEADRELICLSRIRGLADAEVAQLLDVTPAALRKRRERAVAQLRALAQQFPEG